MTEVPVHLQPLTLDFKDVDRHGNPVASMINTRIAIEKLGFDCRYDIFRDRYSIDGSDSLSTGLLSETQLSDAFGRQLRQMVRLQFKFDPGKDNAMEALHAACEAHSHHPVWDYLDRQTWDGKPRIDTWLIDYMGAEDTPLNRAMSRLTLIASVRRIRQPGTKYDLVTVLESPEGYGKSSALSTLYGQEYFTDQKIFGLKDKELQEVLRGRWCVEVPELVGLKKSEIESVKAAITRQTDRARPAYGRATIEIHRSMVIWGTTNDAQYLRALSGENRRFVPVTVGQINRAGLLRDRDQLWAEASAEELMHGKLELPRDLWASASEARVSRTQTDPWEEILADIAERAAKDRKSGVPHVYECDGTTEWVKSSYVLSSLIPEHLQTSELYTRAGKVMLQLGWEKTPNKMIQGKQAKAFFRKKPNRIATAEELAELGV